MPIYYLLAFNCVLGWKSEKTDNNNNNNIFIRKSFTINIDYFLNLTSEFIEKLSFNIKRILLIEKLPKKKNNKNIKIKKLIRMHFF